MYSQSTARVTATATIPAKLKSNTVPRNILMLALLQTLEPEPFAPSLPAFCMEY